MGDGTNPRDTPRNRKVNEVAEAMMEVWNRVHPEPVHATEVATHADMARMLVDRYGLASSDDDGPKRTSDDPSADGDGVAIAYAVWLIALAEKAGFSPAALIDNAPDQIRHRLSEEWHELERNAR